MDFIQIYMNEETSLMKKKNYVAKPKQKQVNACKLVEKQVNKWLASIQPKRNYRETALEIGLPIDGSIL